MTTATKTAPKASTLWLLSNIRKMTQNPIPIFYRNIEKYGDFFNLGMLGKTVFVLNQPAYLQHVLKKNHRNYTKTDIQTEKLAKYIGKGLLTSEGDYWLRQRRLIQPGFHRAKLAGLANIILEEINGSYAEFDAYCESGETFDICDIMMHTTFKIVARSLFGAEISEEELNRIGEVIITTQKHFVRKIRQPFITPWLHLSGQEAAITKLVNDSDDIIFNAIEKRKSIGGEHNDLLDMLLSTRYEDTGKGMTEKQLRDEILILFVAGHETTANAMSWIMYLLDQHPEINAKVLAEVNKLLEGKTELAFEDVKGLSYTKQVINEAMRLYPPAWATDRLALGDDEIGGYPIKKGDSLFLFIYGVHHHPDYWPNPEQFNPDRFAPGNLSPEQKNAYLPFGGGPRLCIGNNFALMEMQLLVAKLVKRYQFKVLPNQVIEAQPLVTLRPRYGIKVKAAFRK